VGCGARSGTRDEGFTFIVRNISSEMRRGEVRVERVKHTREFTRDTLIEHERVAHKGVPLGLYLIERARGQLSDREPTKITQRVTTSP
jgi:hypothetical protein